MSHRSHAGCLIPRAPDPTCLTCQLQGVLTCECVQSNGVCIKGIQIYSTILKAAGLCAASKIVFQIPFYHSQPMDIFSVLHEMASNYGFGGIVKIVIYSTWRYPPVICHRRWIVIKPFIMRDESHLQGKVPLRNQPRCHCEMKQEFIPVGCVPPAAVAVGEGMSTSVHAGILHPPGCGPGDSPPQVWAWRTPSPGVGLENSPKPDPSTSPLGVGLETCNACWDTIPRGQTDTCKNITITNYVCGR